MLGDGLLLSFTQSVGRFVSILFMILPVSVNAYAEVSLEDKLTVQWKHYDAARKLLLDRLSDLNLPPEQRRVSREEWESELNVSGDFALNFRDLKNLRRSQTKRITEARTNAISLSKIDLDKIRSLPREKLEKRVSQFCSQLPKGGMLHIHPIGTIDRSTAKSLLETNNPILPLQEIRDSVLNPTNPNLFYPHELEVLNAMGSDRQFFELSLQDREDYLNFFFLPPGSHPFERFESPFLLIRSALKGWRTIEMAYRAFAKRAVSLGVSYVEFTTGVTTDSLPSLVRVLTKIETDFGLKIRLNRAFHRTQTPSALQAEMPDLFRIQDNPWVVGIDLLGNETQTPALETGQDVYGTVLLALGQGKTQLHRTMHAGELGDPRNPRDAMILGAERLGHGVKLIEDPVALEYAARHRIGVEINLSSNLRLNVVDRLEKHPFLDYLRLGIPVSLSTDDEGIFEIDIQHECEEVISRTDVTYFELKQMILNSIESSFASIEDKRNVLGQLESDFSSFEKDLQTQTVLQ